MIGDGGRDEKDHVGREGQPRQRQYYYKQKPGILPPFSAKYHTFENHKGGGKQQHKRQGREFVVVQNLSLQGKCEEIAVHRQDRCKQSAGCGTGGHPIDSLIRGKLLSLYGQQNP